MPIERDIKVIKDRQKLTRTKTVQELKTLARRQAKHETANIKQFASISAAISLLPTQDVITKTIQDTIKTTVNGKIDGIKVDVAGIGEHLKEQDLAIEALSKKIRPLDIAKNWLAETARGLLYVGTLAAAVYAIFKLFHWLNI